MANPISRLFGRSPQAPPPETRTSSGGTQENATLARLREQREELKAASELLAAGNVAAFLAKLPHLPRLEVLNDQGQSFAHEFLLEAAGQGSVEGVQALLARGVAIRGTGLIRRGSGPGDTALHAAAGRGQTAAARFLVEHGAEINALNGWGEAPLHCAVAQKHLETVGYLLACGADVNARLAGSDIGTPLWRATEKVFLAGAKCLLEHGADPRLINESRRQSPSEGAHRGFEEACRQFHRTHGEERAQVGERIKQYELLVQLLEEAERRLGPLVAKGGDAQHDSEDAEA